MAHMKRLSMPRTWPLERKGSKYITKPVSSHKLRDCIPISIILKLLNIVPTTNEAKKIIKHKSILVDGKEIKDEKYGIGLFDILYIKDIDKYFTIHLSKKGKLKVVQLDKNEAKYKPLKVIGKKVLKQNSLQLNLSDGKNVLVKKLKFGNIKQGDTLIYDIANRSFVEHLPLSVGSDIVVIKGSHVWEASVIKEIRSKHFKKFIKLVIDGKSIELPIDYVIVINKKIKLS